MLDPVDTTWLYAAMARESAAEDVVGDALVGVRSESGSSHESAADML